MGACKDDDLEAVVRRHCDGLFVSGYSPKDTGRLHRDISILLARIHELAAALEVSEHEKHTWWEAALEGLAERTLRAEARVARLESVVEAARRMAGFVSWDRREDFDRTLAALDTEPPSEP